jgi:hypothetical protein
MAYPPLLLHVVVGSSGRHGDLLQALSEVQLGDFFDYQLVHTVADLFAGTGAAAANAPLVGRHGVLDLGSLLRPSRPDALGGPAPQQPPGATPYAYAQPRFPGMFPSMPVLSSPGRWAPGLAEWSCSS